jgi:hypothetical protein
MHSNWLGFLIAGAALAQQVCLSQTLPLSPGETLNGHRIVLAEAVRNQPAVIIAGFSKDAGPACGNWARAVRADTSLTRVALYQMAMLEAAPSLLRGMIKSTMRKGLSASEQDRFVVLTQDETLWRSYFGVAGDKDPWIVLIDSSGHVLWHGHGAASNLEPLLKAALPQ